MTLSATSPLTTDNETRLLDGEIPVEWQSTSITINSRNAETWQLEIISKGVAKAVEAFRVNPEMTKADSRDAYKFGMTPKFQLSKDLLAAGYTQWHCVVQTLSDEEAASRGIKRKTVRYPVHVWLSPTGRPLLQKLKMEGKRVPS
jgi:hypothetical protein